MGILQNKLNEGYAYDSSYGDFVRIALILSGLVSAILYVFQPFGMESFQGLELLSMSLGYGMVTFLVMHLNWLLFKLFGFGDDDWKVWKELIWSLWNFGSIAVGNYLFNILLFGNSFNAGSFVYIFGITIAVGIIPLTIVIFLTQVRNLKHHLEEAQKMNLEFQNKKLQVHEDTDEIKLIAENEKDSITVHSDELLLVESSNNYVELYISDSDGTRRQLMRNSMKRMEDFLSEHSSFYRCHRTYIVNLDRVESINGNSAGYRLKLEGTDIEVPVSRQKVDEFKGLISTSKD